MAAAVFLDSNVLVDPHDRREPERARRAIEVMGALAPTGTAAVSAQVLGEFFWVVTRRIPDPLDVVQGVRSAERHARTWQVLDITLPWCAKRGGEFASTRSRTGTR
jgi:predicted nucleic acid-binding protein